MMLAIHIQTKLRAVGKLGVRLGTFNPKADITALDISTLAERVQNTVLKLWKLLMALIE